MTVVSTTGIIDPRESKSGYQINQYFISLSEKQIKKYTGKTVEVKGKLMVVEGIDSTADLKTQGSENDRYFILEPKIKIIH